MKEVILSVLLVYWVLTTIIGSYRLGKFLAERDIVDYNGSVPLFFILGSILPAMFFGWILVPLEMKFRIKL